VSRSDPHPEPGGFKVPLTSDGKGIPVPLSPEEAIEMRRESDEHDAIVVELMRSEVGTLHDHCQELLTTGSTTIREPNGHWTASLKRSRWRDGWLISEGRRDGGSCSGRLRVSRKGSHEYVDAAITLALASGVAWLREE
jgi:hypothetical protein